MTHFSSFVMNEKLSEWKEMRNGIILGWFDRVKGFCIGLAMTDDKQWWSLVKVILWMSIVNGLGFAKIFTLTIWLAWRGWRTINKTFPNLTEHQFLEVLTCLQQCVSRYPRFFWNLQSFWFFYRIWFFYWWKLSTKIFRISFSIKIGFKKFTWFYENLVQ